MEMLRLSVGELLIGFDMASPQNRLTVIKIAIKWGPYTVRVPSRVFSPCSPAPVCVKGRRESSYPSARPDEHKSDTPGPGNKVPQAILRFGGQVTPSFPIVFFVGVEQRVRIEPGRSGAKGRFGLHPCMFFQWGGVSGVGGPELFALGSIRRNGSLPTLKLLFLLFREQKFSVAILTIINVIAVIVPLVCR
jgi:hypothetical protein